MDLTPLIPIVAIVAIAAVKIARMRATRPDAPSADVTAQLEALEHVVQGLQRELAETQERLDFAERLLSKAREEDRKSTRLNSSHQIISYAVFCLKKKKEWRRRRNAGCGSRWYSRSDWSDQVT